MVQTARETQVLLFHAQKFALRLALDAAPDSTSKQSLTGLLERVGMDDGRMSLTAEHESYILGDLASVVQSSQALREDHRYPTLRQCYANIVEQLLR